MPSDEPARHHELDRECVGLNLLKVTGRLRLQRHPSQNAFDIETGLMLQAEVTELMSRSEPLNAHRTLRRNEDTGPRIVQISTEEPLQGPHEQGQIQGMDGREDIDAAASDLDLLTQAKLLMQPGRGHRAGTYRAWIIRGHHRLASRGARPSAKVFSETSELGTVLLRQVGRLARQVGHIDW